MNLTPFLYYIGSSEESHFHPYILCQNYYLPYILFHNYLLKARHHSYPLENIDFLNLLLLEKSLKSTFTDFMYSEVIIIANSP